MAIATLPTLYQIADSEIRLCIDAYLAATRATHGFSDVAPENLADERARTILLSGLGVRDVSGRPKTTS